MRGHHAVELPAHLPVSFFDRQHTATFVEILELYFVIDLRALFLFVKRFQLSLDRLIHVTATDKSFAKDTTFSENFQSVAETLAHYKLVDHVLVILNFIFTLVVVLRTLVIDHGVHILRLLFDLSC